MHTTAIFLFLVYTCVRRTNLVTALGLSIITGFCIIRLVFLRYRVKLKTVQVLNTHVEPLSSVLFSCSLFCSEHAAILKVEGKFDYYFCVKNK